MSKIQITGDTSFDKNLIEKQLINLVNTRLIEIKDEISSVKLDIEYFEKKYQMKSDEFVNKFTEDKFGDDEDYFIWKGSISILENLIREQNILRETL